MELRQNSRNGRFLSLNGINGVLKRARKPSFSIPLYINLKSEAGLLATDSTRQTRRPIRAYEFDNASGDRSVPKGKRHTIG